MTVHSLQITVTLKVKWNVAVIDKPIPASYTTEVPNGTLLIDIMNKAADGEWRGPFDEYKSTYIRRHGLLHHRHRWHSKRS